ncbi:hypothetical protein BG74_06045 [Sodalis-like endosymbiont of Proechinophthirus fluctus]|nr:hypothetical protein BG74_06045 [Sodalis-like endosymbiont of Proechinophthirus fluctus]
MLHNHIKCRVNNTSMPIRVQYTGFSYYSFFLLLIQVPSKGSGDRGKRAACQSVYLYIIMDDIRLRSKILYHQEFA